MSRSGYVAPDYAVLARRMAEDARAAQLANVKLTAQRQQEASWVCKAGEVGERREKKEAEKEEASLNEERLAARRTALQQKLERENAGYQAELASLAATPEQRRAALESRALDLFAKREKERSELATESQYRAWRSGNDELRTADAKDRRMDAAAAQQSQIRSHAEAAAREAAVESEFAALNAAEKERKEARHVADIAAARAREKEARAMRDLQMEEIAQRKGATAAARARELTALKQKWAADDAAAAAAVQASIEAATIRQAELAKANEARLAAKAAAAAAEKALDAAYARAAAQRAAEATAAERAAAEAKRLGDAEYRKQLAASREQEAESDAAREEMIKMYNDAANAARDAVWAREAAARAALLSETIASNDEKLVERTRQRLEAVQLAALDKAEAEAAAAAAARDAQDAAAARHAAISQRKADLDAQTNGNAHALRSAAAAEAAADAAAAAAATTREAQMRAIEAQRKGMGTRMPGRM